MLNRTRDSGATILLVEDDLGVAATLRDVLESKSHRVWHAGSGAEAKALVAEARPDLVILDLILPDVDGLVLCAYLKERAEAPIIVCSATRRKRDAILALKLGADDFIAKPFDLDELDARVEAVLRRAAQRHATEPETSPDCYQLGELMIDRSRCHVTLGGQLVHLTPIEYQIIGALASHPDEVLSRQELAERVWGYQEASVGRSIDVHMRRLRAKFEAVGVPAPPIVTVRGFGYKIVREARGATPSAA